MDAKIIGKIWFTNKLGVIGIVLVDTEYGEKAYIGVGLGENEENDAREIARWGSTFPLKQAKELV